MKDKQLNIRISGKEKEQLRKDAGQERRSVGEFLLWLWQEWKSKRK